MRVSGRRGERGREREKIKGKGRRFAERKSGKREEKMGREKRENGRDGREEASKDWGEKTRFIGERGEDGKQSSKTKIDRFKKYFLN